MLLCFDWRAGELGEPVNVDGLVKVVKHMRATAGSARKGAVRGKYMQTVGEYQNADKKRKHTQEDDDFGDGEVEVVETIT